MMEGDRVTGGKSHRRGQGEEHRNRHRHLGMKLDDGGRQGDGRTVTQERTG